MAQEKSQIKQMLPLSQRLSADILPSEKPKISKEQINGELLFAVTYGDNAKIRQLINAGADITVRTDRNSTTLHVAATNGHAETCALLIEEYAKANGDPIAFIHAKDRWSRTPLHVAAGYWNIEACRVLIMKGADANATDQYASTPLHEAAIGSNRAKSSGPVAMLLLLAGADPNKERSSDGFSVWDLANGKDIRSSIAHFWRIHDLLPEDAVKAFGMAFLECVSF